MSAKNSCLRIAILAAQLASASAFAGANDYLFEPIIAELQQGDEVVISVRLKQKASGKPVLDAVIVRANIDMAPDGMGEMDSPITPVPGVEPGVYSFKTELPMAGSWLLSIAAKVQGEADTVVGKVRFEATK